jgi:hypothetical protein
MIGEARLLYPQDHIEVDNRLSWLLGRLDCAYGNDAVYIHLKRNVADTATSLVRRYNRGIIKAYRGKGIIMRLPEKTDPISVAADYCETVNRNIEHFLKDKTHKMVFHIETAGEKFPEFWRLIGATGDLEAGLSEFNVRHNATSRTRMGIRHSLRGLIIK